MADTPDKPKAFWSFKLKLHHATYYNKLIRKDLVKKERWYRRTQYAWATEREWPRQPTLHSLRRKYKALRREFLGKDSLAR